MTPEIPGTLKNFRHVSDCRSRFSKKARLRTTFQMVTQAEVGRSEVGRTGRPQNQPNRPYTSIFVVKVHNLLHVASKTSRNSQCINNTACLADNFTTSLSCQYTAVMFQKKNSGFFYFTVLLFTYVTDNYPLRTRNSFFKRYREVPHH
jgi:hypothetical protein